MESAALETKQHREPAERRACMRRTADSLIFVKLGDLNGGIAFNISEGGLALSAANCLPDGQLPELSIQLPESGDWIRAEGQIAWRSNSNKEAGIRFVELSQDARQRIKDWICSDSRNVGSELQTDDLGIFNDLETPIDTPPEVPSNPSSASIPPTDTAVPDGGVLGPASTSANPYYAEPVSDRRVYPRKRIIPLGYIQLGEDNGGIALNVSEGGLAITAAKVLLDDDLPSIRLQFPDAGHWVDVKGVITWKSESKREAGIRFVELTEEARQHLSHWISSPARSGPVQKQADLISPSEENQQLHLVFPSATERLRRIDRPLAPANVALRNAEPPLTPVADAPLSATDSQAANPNAEISPFKPPTQGNLPVRTSLVHGLRRAGQNRWAWRTVAVVVVLMELVLVRKEWTVFRLGGAQAIEAVMRRQRTWTGGPGGVVLPPPARPASVPQPQVQRMEQMAHNKAPLLPEKSENVSVPSAPSKSLHDRVGDTSPSAITDSRHLNRGVQDSPGSNRETMRSTLVSAPVANADLAGNRSDVPKAPPASWPQQDLRLIAPLTSIVSPPRSAPPPELNSRAETRNRSGGSPAPSPKRADSSAILTGTVAVLTNPYPFIRPPHGLNGKKSRNKTSLQLGQLISRVEPAYPEEAKQRGIEGTVKMHVLVSREGMVQKLVTIDGPPLLVPSVVRAVQQWRYTETLLAGKAVETEDDIAVTFRLASHAPGK